jgi:CBS domain-containing protein
MPSDPATAFPSMSVVETAKEMIQKEKGPLPVVEGDRLVGILSEADLRRDEGPWHSQQQTPTQRWLSTVCSHRCG